MNNPDASITPDIQQDYANATVNDYFQLLKPRVMSLVVITAFIGAFMAPGPMHPYLFFVSILSIAIGAGASGAFNMWYDRDIDKIMERTKKRPLPKGTVSPDDVLILASFLSIGSIVTLYFASNALAAGLLAFTIFFYAVIYTILLKRSTPQNIVIGGAAGAFPPMIGWAAASDSLSLEPLIMFMIIFLWTPPHFWALALFKTEDYEKASIPMMPITAGIHSTKTQIVIYSIVLAVCAALPFVFGYCGGLYLIVSTALSIRFIHLSRNVLRYKELAWAKKLFGFSIFYLFGIFVAMMLDKILGLG